MIECPEDLPGCTLAEMLWASPREVLNVYQANDAGCHIITMTPDLLAKVALRNKDLDDYSQDTVKMFFGMPREPGTVCSHQLSDISP